jgi:hypothetical protein
MLWGPARKMGVFAHEKWALAPIDFRKFPCTLLFGVHGPDEAIRHQRGSVGRAWPEKPLICRGRLYEAAWCAPGGAVTLLLLMFGIIKCGFALYEKEVIINTSREAARAGIILTNPRPAAIDITNVVRTYLTSPGWHAATATITVTGAQAAFGSYLMVEVAYPRLVFRYCRGLSRGLATTLRSVLDRDAT